MKKEVVFKNGVFILRSGKKIIGKAYDRKEFFKNIKNPKFTLYNKNYPFSLEIYGMGLKEFKTKKELIESLNEFM